MLELVFIVLGVFCALASSAIEECSESKLIRAAEDGDKKAAKMLPVVQEPDDFCATMRVGAFGFGFFALMNPLTARFVQWVEGLVPGTDAVRQVVGGVLWVVLLLLAVALVDFAPQRYAWHRADKAARGLFPMANLLAKILWPVTWLLIRLAEGTLRIFGVNPNAQIEEVSEDEILLMVGEGEETGAIGQEEKELIENIFEFDDMTAEDVMVHRTDMEMIWLDDSDEEIVHTIQESGLSRFPVCGEDVDDIVGILNTRQYLLNARESEPKSLTELLRPAFFVPESVKADVLFRDMQRQKVHMAIVVDEYGGTSGLVTMEDLLEQLVGEIYDEFDQEEEQEITALGDDRWRIAGAASLEDIAEALELDIPEE
ncbi:MAG: HlyC/CorC family transporter, partial [Clostridia bacterium]|nr:HlyC/CorC family transporter [Clostridia bacterium]